MRQQRVQQQEAETPDHVHERAAGGAGEGVPEDALSRCVREGAAGHEDGVDGGQGAGTEQNPLNTPFHHHGYTLKTDVLFLSSRCQISR